MRLAVLGTPCGGTGYVQALLRASGLRVGHEALRPDGIVCGFAALGRHQGRDTSAQRVLWAPGAFDLTCRLIRHPLDVAVTLPWVLGMSAHPIGAAARAIRQSAEFRAELAAEWAAPDDWRTSGPTRVGYVTPTHRADDLTRLALRFWVLTHEAIPADAPVIRLDHVAADLRDRVAPLLGRPIRAVAPRARRKPRRWPRWTWEQWTAADPEYAALGRALWDRHGAADAGPERSRP